MQIVHHDDNGRLFQHPLDNGYVLILQLRFIGGGRHFLGPGVVCQAFSQRAALNDLRGANHQPDTGNQ